MEKVQWKVEGMDCTTCALNIHKYLEKQGMQKVKVNYANGDVSFEADHIPAPEKIIKGIKDLGYTVTGEHQAEVKKKKFLSTHLERFWICLPFTLVLMLHMFDKWWHIHWLMNPWIQLALSTPGYYI
ncbi:MAG: cation-translocating P-type ATPase, partial [Bacteroidia bacterium]|nr:cation-translocating P-type ATPase [Bacteroidia bacterium]